MNRSTKLILSIIQSHSGGINRDAIMKVTKLSYTTVSMWLQLLVERGLIRVERIHAPGRPSVFYPILEVSNGKDAACVESVHHWLLDDHSKGKGGTDAA